MSEQEELKDLYLPAMALVGAVMLARTGHLWAAGIIPAAVQRTSAALVPLQRRYGDEDTDMVTIFERAGIPLVDFKDAIPEVETPGANDTDA